MFKVIYTGVFLDTPLKGTLENVITDQHITDVFKPKPEELVLLEKFYNQKVTFKVVGYGNDGENEGYLVEVVDAETQELKEHFENRDKLHITLSVSDIGLPKNTINLEFKSLVPFEVVGTYDGALESLT